MAEKFRPIERRVRVDEVLQLLQLSRRTFYRRIAEGKYPPLSKDGRISFYPESTVSELVNQCWRHLPKSPAELSKAVSRA